jgi:hypothetical protein
MFTLLFSLLLAWLAGHPVPAPVVPPAVHSTVQPAPHVQAPEPAGVESPAGSSPVPAPAPATVVPPVADDSGVGQLVCQPGEEWQGREFGCVAVQLPEETQGRAYG